MSDGNSVTQSWRPLAAGKLQEIRDIFARIYPAVQYGDLARQITEHWLGMLRGVWERKAAATRDRDLRYAPGDPLSRIEQKTLVIAYPDSVSRSGEKTLLTLGAFLRRFFPAVQGLHLLPSCAIVEERFNDGYFSQVERDRIHPRFGTDQQFSLLMESTFSMGDFVLNHVDIENPRFQAYLNGDERAGRCFYVFSEAEYQERLDNGDFAAVFRPRPFPLFTIFRRRPEEDRLAALSLEERIAEMGRRLATAPPSPVLGILYLFNKVKNDQMLLDEDYRLILAFRTYLQEERGLDPDRLFTVSTTQEVRHTPYIFRSAIATRADLLQAIGLSGGLAEAYQRHDRQVFGEEIRALTTFSHVQVDLNTGSLEGLSLLADDFSWYLSKDINLLRLDAANYAFKKWQTSCFGLPEVRELMRVLYLSMEAVSPRIVPNLEVNDSLSTVLAQMADRESAPPMMYDFHLASILPAVFNGADASILPRIFDLISRYQIPKSSIRFSLAESHDGKSVRGSLDLLTAGERRALVEVVEANGGQVKYKASAAGPEPYELCCSTRDSLLRLRDERLEADRYLAFYTLAFALMGRNVKSIYFNDLLALANDHERLERSGELRDLKRTRSQYATLEALLSDAGSFAGRVARGINELIALVDSDPALHFRGNEAEVLQPRAPAAAGSLRSVAVVHCSAEAGRTLVVVNLAGREQEVSLDPAAAGLGARGALYDNIGRGKLRLAPGGVLLVPLAPYQRLWLTGSKISIARQLRFRGA